MMWKLAGLVTAAALAPAATFHQSGFRAEAGGLPAGWRLWAARPEIAPKVYVDDVHSRGEAGSLVISGASNAAVYGGWEHVVDGIEAGSWYRLTAWYRAEGLSYEPGQVVARLDWRDRSGRRAGQPDYAYRTERAGTWRRVTLEAPAPEQASAVAIQLFLAHAPLGTVWWDDISLEPIPPPGRREVTVAAIHYRPSGSKSPAENVERFIEAVEKAVPGKVDLILLPEGITLVGTGKKYADVAEPVPGPTTTRLGQYARRRNAWIVAGIYEREAPAIYNTAILLDRQGRLAGKYRKVYLPREEIEGGLRPGDDFPVFQTDFGRIGIMICWDLQYADPARHLALKGAELVLLPIWGGNEALPKARALENHIYLAASGYDHPTYILDPEGRTLATAPELGQAAIATLDLNRRFVDKWLGWMKGRFMKELRLDLPLAQPGFEP